MVDYSAYHWAKKAQQWVESIGNVLRYKGSVATYADLPSSDQQIGDMYNVLADGSNYAWDGTSWDALSGIVDLSAYRTSADQDIIDSGKVPTTRTVNGKALSSNVSLNYSDVGAVASNNSITGATKCKITYDSKGLVTAGADLSSSDVTTALGYTPYNSTNPSGYQANVIETIKVNGAEQTVTSKAVDITVPTNNNQLTNGAGYITGITSTDVTNALGYTPYNSSNPNGYTSNVGTVTSVNNTSPDGSGNVSISIPSEVTETTVSNWGFTKNTGTVTSVNNVSPVSGNVTLSIPTVNNSTITITQGGVTKGSFTLNQASGDTIALDAGGGSGLPSQTGHSGEFLTTDGTDASWAGITIPTVNDATLTIQQNGTTVDTFTANSSTNKTVNIKTEQFKLFHHDWFDYLLNDQSWLRADTFSWQDGTVYTDAYQHLVDDYNTATAQWTTETIGSYTIWYLQANDGHKIIFPESETTAVNIYNESGVAWYYILDTTNQRFKLPRENPAREVLGQSASIIDGAGNNVFNPKIYNSSGNASSANSAIGAYNGKMVYKGITATGANGETYLSLSADLSETTGVYKGKQYLYFYVGQFSQSATEQTAGLNASLFNGKADIDLSNATSNASTSAKETISGWGMPSGTYIDKTLSTGTYTADGNGYISVGVSSSTYVKIETSGLTSTSNRSNNGSLTVTTPVKKSESYTITATQSSLTVHRFVYAVGDEP